MSDKDLTRRIDAVRRFNRLYTKTIGVLHEGHLQSTYSLTEVRVLYELAQRENPTAAELGKALDLDAGYLSRILQNFEKRDIVDRTPSESDGRQSHLTLTKRGHEAFTALDRRASEEIGRMLGELSIGDQLRLVQSIETIERLLGAQPLKAPYVLRPHGPGDMGWIVHRHGALYATEYGWDSEFEGLVAGIVAKFVAEHDPARERCWIAEKDGTIVGSVLLVRSSKTIAQLRLLLVEPEARGMGIGRRLVDECVRFARQVGYRKVTLWTNDVLHAARRIYEAAGFVLVKEERHHSFGKDLVGQTWELTF